MKNSVLTIMKKELARFFRDRRVLISTLLLPGLMIYVLYSFMGDALQNNFSTGEDYIPAVSVAHMPETLKTAFSASGLKLTELDESEIDSAKQQVKDGESDLCVVFPADFDAAVAAYSPSDGQPAPNVAVYYNTSESNSEVAYNAVTALLDSYETAMTNKFNVNQTDEVYDLADERDVTAMIFSSMLPMLLMMFMFSGCMAVAPESIAGEKERGTIATLLITPVKRGNIAIGKILALSIISLLSGISSTVGTILSLPKLMGGDESGVVTNVYTVGDYAWLALIVLSTVLLIVTIISITSAFAKTIKEAQTYVSPIMIVTMVIGVTGMFGDGIQTNPFIYLIPLYNSVQGMVGIFSFDIVPSYIGITVLSNIAYAGLGVLLLSRLYSNEKVIFSR